MFLEKFCKERLKQEDLGDSYNMQAIERTSEKPKKSLSLSLISVVTRYERYDLQGFEFQSIHGYN